MARRGRMPMDVSDAIKLLETKPARGAAYSVPTREAVRMVLRDRAIMEKLAETHRRLGSVAVDALSMVRRELADIQDQRAVQIEAARREAQEELVSLAVAERGKQKAELFALVVEAYRAVADAPATTGVTVTLTQVAQQSEAGKEQTVSRWEAEVRARPLGQIFTAGGDTAREALAALLSFLRQLAEGNLNHMTTRYQVADRACRRGAELLNGTASA